MSTYDEADRILFAALDRRRGSGWRKPLPATHEDLLRTIHEEIDAGEASAEAAVCVVLEANAISYRFDHPEGAPDILVIED